MRKGVSMHRVDNRIARRHLRRGGVALVGATAALVALLGPGAPHAAALTTSTTTVTSSNNPAPAKSTVTYTATVTPSTPTPTGTINFQDGGNTTTCTAQPLSSGTATCVTSYGTPGNYTVTATYGGDATYAGSTGTLAGGETITFLTTTNTVSSSLNPSTAGQQVTYTVQTNPQVHGGSFNFKDGGTTITGCGAQNSSGTGSATCAVTYGSAGSHAITVAYSGDTSYSPQPASNTVTQTVNPAPPPPPPPFHPEGVGQPGTAVTPNNTQLVFWQGAGGHLFEAWWN
ncbi:MAG: Ig-like domain-containing protein, partial [Acidimicrobiales bacterium]